MNNDAKRLNLLTLCVFFTIVILLTGAVFAQEGALDDQEIADAIEDEYILDRVVDVNKIDVNVNEGIVELTGTVNNSMAKDRATYIAELVKGVRAVSNRIEVRPSVFRTDDEISNDVKHALHMDPAANSYEVQISVKDNIVVLDGVVDSFAEKTLSEQIAKSVKGVVGVKNKITVSYGSERKDHEIERDIRGRLRWDVLVDNGLIEVSVKRGKVTLSGSVGSAAEKRQAYWDAWVAGVESVDNSKLEVKPLAGDEELLKDKYVLKSDEEIKQAVKDATYHDPRVFSFNITPYVKNGWVTLRGTVNNYKAKIAAGQLAQNTVGVRGVINRIKLRIPSPPKDKEIVANIQSALAVNPYTESYEIDIKIRDGKVTLAGVVDSYVERTVAEHIVSGIHGVTEVKNSITVSLARVYIEPFSRFYYLYPPVVSLPLPDTAKSDQEICDDIRGELSWSPFVDSDQVYVDVENGVAILTGTVDTMREYNAATDNAWEGGAVMVINKLKVR